LDLKNFKMIRKLNFYLCTTFFFLILTSCSKNNGTESLIEDKLESMSGKEMLRELLIKNDNDVNQLARIFDCSPSSLRRILEGKETIATPNAKIDFKNTLHQVLVTKEKTLDQLDPYKQSWLFKIKFFFRNNYIPFILVLVFAIIIGVCGGGGLSDRIFLIWFICLFIYLTVISIIWFKGEPIKLDKSKNTIDTVWEKPISK
jgi:hypothetical protein